MKKTYFLYLVITVMMLLNLATVIFVWKSYPQLPRRPAPPRLLNPGDFIIRELGFDESQRKEFDVLRDEHRRRLNENRDSVRKCRDQLYGLLAANDTKRAEALMTKIGGLEREKELITFQHFQEIRALCNGGQQKKFDRIIEQVLQLMKAGPEPGAPPKEKG